MGLRITKALSRDQHYRLRLVEPAPAGRSRLAEHGFGAVDQAEALHGADVVVFAVPDRIIGQVATDVVDALDPHTSMLFLDPAAVAADRVPRRSDVSCYVTHPTHPPLYSLLGEADADARRDYWGGGLAHQAIVFATAWASTDDVDEVEQLAADMFAPVSASHRITVEQMAMLEPALSETLTNGCLDIIRSGMLKVIEAGVPQEAAWDFLMGHLQIGIALIFDQLDWTLSEGAQLALAKSRQQLFKPAWADIFSPESIQASVRAITGG
jgi:hypothetical protein